MASPLSHSKKIIFTNMRAKPENKSDVLSSNLYNRKELISKVQK
jgi:hypothetical protein